MDRKYRAYLKLNLVSLFFMAVSFISVTLAWFAYSGLSTVSTDIAVKSWLIEFQKGDKAISNDIVISLSEIYPGMETIHETVKIENKGDSDAQLNYSIVSARILAHELDVEALGFEKLKDELSHKYPFSINISLSKNFVLSKGRESVFDVSVSWPLDSINDELVDEAFDNDELDKDELSGDKRDSDWGSLAYQFAVDEQKKLDDDPGYKVRSSIKIVLSLNAQQIINDDESSDIDYGIGDLVLYDVENNTSCEHVGFPCIITHVVDINNKVGDDIVTLLPDLLGTYSSGVYSKYDEVFNSTIDGWNVTTKTLGIDHVLNIVSLDVINSVIVRDGLSDSIIGYTNYGDRIKNIVKQTTLYNGYFSFLNERFDYFTSSKCYWLKQNYDENKAFALTKFNDESSRIYIDDFDTECSVVPLIIASKRENLN